MKGIFSTIVAMLAFMMSAYASPELKWLASEYNFGAFRETEGPRTGMVRFVNEGDDATFIRSVRPSCGCTAAAYTESMIQPGDTATVSFTYNPAGRPGSFDKTVRVYIGSDNDLKIIRIYGTVIGAPETLEANYPFECGPLRLGTLTQTMGEVRKGSTRHAFVNIYNQGNDTIRPEWRSSSRALEVDLTPKVLAPGEIGVFGFYLNTNREKETGPVEYRVFLHPDKDSGGNEEAAFKVAASIVEDSNSMTVEELERSPRAYLVPEFIDLGEPVAGADIPFELEILNDGKDLLVVKQIYSVDGDVRIKSNPKKVKGGKRERIKGILSTTGIPEGAFRIHLEVITNDPLHPQRTANLVGIRQ